MNRMELTFVTIKKDILLSKKHKNSYTVIGILLWQHVSVFL